MVVKKIKYVLVEIYFSFIYVILEFRKRIILVSLMG